MFTGEDHGLPSVVASIVFCLLCCSRRSRHRRCRSGRRSPRTAGAPRTAPARVSSLAYTCIKAPLLSPGRGQIHYYLPRPRLLPFRASRPPPAPSAGSPPRPGSLRPAGPSSAPSPAREWSEGRWRPVMGTRRHKERSKQGARRSPSGPFIKPRPRGRGRRPPTARRAAAPGLCEWSAAARVAAGRPARASAARDPPDSSRGAATPPRRGYAAFGARRTASQEAGLTGPGLGLEVSWGFLPPCFPLSSLAALLPRTGVKRAPLTPLPRGQGRGGGDLLAPGLRSAFRLAGRFISATPQTLAYALA